MQMTIRVAERPGDRERAAAVLAAGRQVVAQFENVSVAEHAGYREFAPGSPGMERHFVNVHLSGAEARQLDLLHPGALLYDRLPDGSLHIRGVMYTASGNADASQLDARIPRSIATWHRHSIFALRHIPQPTITVSTLTARSTLKTPVRRHMEHGCRSHSAGWRTCSRTPRPACNSGAAARCGWIRRAISEPDWLRPSSGPQGPASAPTACEQWQAFVAAKLGRGGRSASPAWGRRTADAQSTCVDENYGAEARARSMARSRALFVRCAARLNSARPSARCPSRTSRSPRTLARR